MARQPNGTERSEASTRVRAPHADVPEAISQASGRDSSDQLLLPLSSQRLPPPSSQRFIDLEDAEPECAHRVEAVMAMVMHSASVPLAHGGAADGNVGGGGAASSCPPEAGDETDEQERDAERPAKARRNAPLPAH